MEEEVDEARNSDSERKDDPSNESVDELVIYLDPQDYKNEKNHKKVE